ncbi:toll-like receptor 2 type-2 [Engraulis encrasicolus]|uniref:toll-like receptor 2 type-2 n=1 Tax=Engraulis encrasicolus TaxID=184585 RepID=UPI002FD17C1D
METLVHSCGLSSMLLLLLLDAQVRAVPQLQHHTSPTTPCDATDAVRVDLSNHNLTSVPSSTIPKNTCYLDLSYNRISELRSDDLAQLCDLRVLRMVSCGLSKISPDALRYNPKLQELHLASNKLTVIPELPAIRRLSILDLSDNVYASYALGKSFQELKSLETLSLGSPVAARINCSDLASLEGLPLKQLRLGAGVELSGYQSGSLSRLIHLEEVILNMTFCDCQQAFKNILKDLVSTRVARLTLVRFLPSLCNVSSDLFVGLRNFTQLRWLTFKEVWFNSSTLVQTMSNVLQSPIEALVFLNMTYNEDTADGFHLFDIATHSRLGQLRAMIFNHYVYHSLQYIFKYPEVQVNTSLFSGLKKVQFSDAGINVMPCGLLGNLPALEVLDLSHNLLKPTGLWYKCPDTDIFPALSALILRGNAFEDLSDVAKYIGESMKSLRKLDLSINPVKLHSLPSWPSSLHYISLSDTELGQNVFGHLSPNFFFVNLSRASIETLDTDSLVSLTQLKTLVLTSNHIEGLPLNLSLPQLEELYVDNNKISSFDLKSFRGLPKLKRVHAGHNPFVCDCALHTFLTLFNESMLVGWPFDYRCHSPSHLAGTLLKEFHPSVVSCNLWIQTSIGLTVVLVLCGVLAWVFRAVDGAWYLRMVWVWLAVKRRSQRDRDSRLARVIFRFDAFISYSHSDANWVETQLVPHLEGAGLHLCLHERDFLPGRWIIDNIVDSVEQSRRVLFVLSCSFVHSEWCNYELFFAQHHALGERHRLRHRALDSLAFVLLEPIPLDSLPRKFLRLQALLRRRTYLQWPVEEQEAKRRLFWASLRAVLGCSRGGGSLVLRHGAEEMMQLCRTAAAHMDETKLYLTTTTNEDDSSA